MGEKYGNCHVYDHSQPRVRQYWRDNCIKMTQSGAIDGCGADFSAGTHNSVARDGLEVTMSFMNLNESVATTWRAGRRQTMIDTTAALGGGLLVGKDGAELGDHLNGVLHEGCPANNATINLLRNLTAKAKAMKQRQVYQCHGSFDNNTVSAFLIGAGTDHYLASGGWDNSVGGHWDPILEQPLGEPMSDATYDHKTSTWARSFAAGTHVSFNAMSNQGTIEWGSRTMIV